MVLLSDKVSNIESKFDMQRQFKTGRDFFDKFRSTPHDEHF